MPDSFAGPVPGKFSRGAGVHRPFPAFVAPVRPGKTIALQGLPREDLSAPLPTGVEGGASVTSPSREPLILPEGFFSPSSMPV